MENSIIIKTPLGVMRASFTSNGLGSLNFIDNIEVENIDTSEPVSIMEQYGDCPFFRLFTDELTAYFVGSLKAFTIPLMPSGTDFQRRVWSQLQHIPYGHTRTYREQSLALGNVLAIRAVGHANGQNPVAIIIPCHRVIGSDGTLTGYGGGLWRKTWLLQHESPGRQATLAL